MPHARGRQLGRRRAPARGGAAGRGVGGRQGPRLRVPPQVQLAIAVPRTSPVSDAALASPTGSRLVGRARLGRLTKQLAARLGPGDIAVIDHPGLDPLSAQDLAASGATAVVNVARSTSARYPNLGPSVLVETGVTLLDAPGATLFDTLADGDELTLEDGCVLRGEVVVARGSVLDLAAVALALEAARGSLDSTLDDFVANTLAHVSSERGLLAEPLCLPELRTAFGGRPALVVARGAGAGADLRALSDFVRRTEPTLVGVDGGADLIAAVGWRPDVIVGDMDSASDRALASGAELLVHAYRDGSAPGATRLRRLGLAHEHLTVPGTSEDAAVLLAAEKGARPVVSVGSGIGLADFLDRGRAGMASTLLTRLRLGEVLVDARGLGLLSR